MKSMILGKVLTVVLAFVMTVSASAQETIELDVDAGLDTLQSYRQHLAGTFEFQVGDESEESSTQFIFEYIAPGDVRVQETRQSGEDPEVTALYRVDGRGFYYGTDGNEAYCEEDPDLDDDPLLLRDTMWEGFTGSAKVNLIARGETVRGVVVDHYEMETVEFPEEEDYEASGEIWLAQDGGYIVRFTVQVLFSSENASLIAELTYDLEAINGLTAIELPAECR